MSPSAATPLGPLARAKLGVEIVLCCLRARRDLRRLPIESVVARLRLDDNYPEDLLQGPPHARIEQAARLGRAVSRTLVMLPGDTRCLVRSLVLTSLLARRGIAARLVIGARSGPDFLAHAWVECAGTPVLDPGDGSFGRLVEL